MLHEITDLSSALTDLPQDPIRHYSFVYSIQHAAEDSSPLLLQDESRSGFILAVHGARFTMALNPSAPQGQLVSAFLDLSEGRVQSSEGWPSPQLKRDWQKADKPSFFFDTMPPRSYDAAIEAGFTRPEDDHRNIADIFYFTGKPRFSQLIQHSCRLGRAIELLPLLIRGIHYDPEGVYVRRCLQHQPSFVCEVDGQPVCWSTQHMNNAMAMIYTPEEHRRHGYARSLAGFQIDHCLRRDGIAFAHVVEGNTASSSMLRSLGALEIPDHKVCWRLLHPPATMNVN